ncbi:MAG: family 16 glycosylhydrolase [Balneolaceae bacterium]
MKHAVTLLLFSILIFTGTFQAQAQRFELIWSDEFDTATLNTQWWSPEIGDGCNIGLCGWGNNELQVYTSQPKNLFIENGILHIRAQREDDNNSQFSSARIKTAGKFAFTYGRIEASIKLPIGTGFWPAFWMMPEESVFGGWPRSGEIDIMEYRGNVPDIAEGAIHFWREGCTGNNAVACREFMNGKFTLPEGNFAEDFHLFALEWDETGLTWFVDDEAYFRIDRDDVNARWYPFDESFHIILNLAIGGNFLPNPTPETEFPQSMQVEYVRVYQDVNEAPEVSFNQTETIEAEPLQEIAISIAASDSDGFVERVELLVNGELQQVFTEPPYETTLTFDIESCYDLQAVAFDNDNAATTSEELQVIVGNGCQAGPFLNSAFPVPGAIPFWQYNVGGPDVSYNDGTKENQGVALFGDVARPFESVDLKPDPEESVAYAIFDSQSDEWTEYFVQVEQAGTYLVSAELETNRITSFDLYLNGELATSFTGVRASNGRHFTDQREVDLPAGEHLLRFQNRSGEGTLYQLVLEQQVSVSIDDQPNPVPTSPELLPPYPNPFNPSVTIAYELPAAGDVRILVSDILGRTVSVLQNQSQSAGRHTVNFDASELGSGVYYVRMISGQFTQTRSVTLIK